MHFKPFYAILEHVFWQSNWVYIKCQFSNFHTQVPKTSVNHDVGVRR